MTIGIPPDSSLPFEIERVICEIAIFNFPKSLLSIILVAHRFRTWFEPELYRVIRSGGEFVIPPLYQRKYDTDDESDVLDIPRIQVFGKHVQHVLLQKRTVEEIASILECCPNVFNLALWMVLNTSQCTRLIPILQRLPLRKLSFDPTTFFPDCSDSPDSCTIPLNQLALRNLTHLRIINGSPFWSKWKELALLPALTHLALSNDTNQEFIDQVLSKCVMLELIVIFVYDTGGFMAKSLSEVEESVSTQKDNRIIPLHPLEYSMDDWEEGAHGRDDFWIVAQKQKEREYKRKHG